MENITLIGFILLESFWFSLPAYVANMAPVLAKGIPFLNIPVDLGKTYRGKPLFGSHKTYRGFFFGIVSAMIICYIQTILYEKTTLFQDISLIDYGSTCFILLGFLFGFGALAGDTIKSFFKRRMNIVSGRSWFPFDQIDYLIGILLFVSFIYIPPMTHIFAIFVLGVILSLISSYIGYLFGMKDAKI